MYDDSSYQNIISRREWRRKNAIKMQKVNIYDDVADDDARHATIGVFSMPSASVELHEWK